jgi:hypothetical protein
MSRPRVRRRAVLLLLATSCGGSSRYAGLTKSEAIQLAKTRIAAERDAAKRSYYIDKEHHR